MQIDLRCELLAKADAVGDRVLADGWSVDPVIKSLFGEPIHQRIDIVIVLRDPLERHAGDVLVLGRQRQRIADEHGQANAVGVGKALRKVIKLVEPDDVRLRPIVNSLDAFGVFVDLQELLVETQLGHDQGVQAAVAVGELCVTVDDAGDQRCRGHTGADEQAAPVGIGGRPGLLGMNKVDGQLAGPGPAVQQADGACEAAAAGVGQFRPVDAAKRVQQVDWNATEQLLEPLAQGRVLGAAGHVNGLHRMFRRLAAKDVDIAPHLAGQGVAGRQRPGQQQLLAAADTEFGPAIGQGQHGHGTVRRVGRRRESRRADHLLQAGQGPERPRCQGQQLQPSGLAQDLVGLQQFPADNQGQGPLVSVRRRFSGRRVVDDDLVRRIGQLLDRLKANQRRLF